MIDRYLITGGAGFIGSHIAKELLKKEHAEIHILKRTTSNLYRIQSILKNVHLHNCDLLEVDSLYSIAKNINPTYLLHFATENQYKQRLLDLPEAYIKGQEVILNVLNICRKLQLKKILCAGSSMMFNPMDKVIYEDSPPNPHSTRGIIKLNERNLIVHCAQKYNLPIYIPIIFRAYGAFEQEGRLFINLFNAAYSEKPIKLVNQSYHKDYIYIKDLTNGLIKFLHSDLPNGTEINFGSGKQYNAHEIAQLIQSLTNKKINISLQEYESNRESINRQASVQKAKKLLNWEPTTTIEQGLANLYEWYKNEYDK